MATPLLGVWDEPGGEVLDVLTRHAKFSADSAVIGLPRASDSEKTRAAIRSALRMLLANGLITVVPVEQWPAWVNIDPPRPS